MLNDMYNDFFDTDFTYYFPDSFKDKTRDYLTPNVEPRVTWYEGDTEALSFPLDASFELSEDETVQIMFFNFRHELIACFENNEIEQSEDTDDCEFIVKLTKETTKLFKKGIYYYCIKILNGENIITFEDSKDNLILVQ